MYPRARHTALLFSLLLVSLLSLPAVAGERPPSEPGKFRAGQPAPPISGVDHYGRPFTLGSHKGEWVFVNFAFGTSAHSIAMARNAQGFVDFLRENQVKTTYLTVLLGDTVGRSSDLRAAINWALSYELTEPILHVNGQQPRSSLYWALFTNYLAVAPEFRPYDNPGFPLTVIVSPEGLVHRVVVGEWEPAHLLDVIGRNDLKYTGAPANAALEPPTFQLTMTYGAASGSRMEPSSESTFTTGNLPQNLVLSSLTVPLGEGVIYALTGFLSDASLPRDVPITLSLSGLQWPAVPGKLLNGSFISVVTEQREHTFGLPFTSSGDDPITFGPFTLNDSGLRKKGEIYEFMIGLQWLTPSPLNYAMQIELGTEDKRIRAYARMARLNIAPGGNTASAIDYFRRVEERVTSLPRKKQEAMAAYLVVDFARSALALLEEAN